MMKKTQVNKFHLKTSVGSTFRLGQIVILALALAPWAHANEDTGRLKGLMHAFVLEYAKMSPYLVSDATFTSAKGKETIKDSLTVLEKRIQRNPPPEVKAKPGFRITYGLLSDHISKTKEVFDRGEMEYARMRVKGIGNLCAGCHMQVPTISKFSAFEFVVERSKKNSFENADFLFTIRKYDEALKMVDDLIRGYPKSGLTSDQLGVAYRYKLAILARVFRDPKAATASLSQDLKNAALPVDVRQNVKTWMETLQKWSAEKVDPAKLKTPELLAYVDKNLPADLNRKIAPGDPQLLNLLRMSGLLYERLYGEQNGEQVQGILYDLARCERSLAPYYWYSMNEIYLKECVTGFPKGPYSKRCYDAYESGMNERYFGKTIPAPVRESIQALKDYL